MVRKCLLSFPIHVSFDSVPHLPLLRKLADINLDPYIRKWVHTQSTVLSVVSGAAQGSVLGPLLFLV